MQYEQMREWRDICEFLDGCWYKFDDSDCFPLLQLVSRPHREELWSLYMIQFAKWGQHPEARYRRRSDYRKDYGWRLLPGWEIKIDFLEKITLFGRNPDDLPQPWKTEIWQAIFDRREQEEESIRATAERITQYQIMMEKKSLQRMEDGCPIKIDCTSMCNTSSTIDCPNFVNCQSAFTSVWRNL